MSSPWQRWRAHDQAYNKTFCLKLKSYKYNACLAITGAIKGSSREKLYQELRLETLRKRCWLCRLYLFYKIQKNKFPSQLFRLIPNTSGMHVARNSNNLKCINAKHNFLKNPFFASAKSEWNKLSLKIRDSATLESFTNYTTHEELNFFDVLQLALVAQKRINLNRISKGTLTQIS